MLSAVRASATDSKVASWSMPATGQLITLAMGLSVRGDMWASSGLGGAFG